MLESTEAVPLARCGPAEPSGVAEAASCFLLDPTATTCLGQILNKATVQKSRPGHRTPLRRHCTHLGLAEEVFTGPI